ncbi:MAG: hypothetical protein VKJ44_06785 [Synechococcus sp.]|nr:hypothetical protein [Synechococcus sp.]
MVQKQTLLEGLRALPGDERLLRSLAILLEQEGAWRELLDMILEQLPQVPRGSPLEAHACYLGGKAALELGELRQALALSGRSMQMQPNIWYVQHIHGRVLARLGRRLEALQAQQRCAELAPAFPWCWFEIGQLQLAQAQVTAARQAFERALRLQEERDPAGTALFRQALEGVEQQAQLAERQAAALGLWPDQPPPAPGERLPALDELALAVEQFRRFLDQHQQRIGAG